MFETQGGTRNRTRDLPKKGSAFITSSDHWTSMSAPVRRGAVADARLGLACCPIFPGEVLESLASQMPAYACEAIHSSEGYMSHGPLAPMPVSMHTCWDRCQDKNDAVDANSTP